MEAKACLTILFLQMEVRSLSLGEKCPISTRQEVLLKGSSAKDGRKGCCSPLGYQVSPHHDNGLASKPGGAIDLYLHISWRLSVHIVDDGEVPIEEGVSTGWA